MPLPLCHGRQFGGHDRAGMAVRRLALYPCRRPRYDEPHAIPPIGIRRGVCRARPVVGLVRPSSSGHRLGADMRLGGRLAAAIEVLDDIDGRHRPAADALKDWGLSHRFAGAGDRAAIGNIVYDALRRRRSAVWLLDDDAPRAAGFGAIILETAMTPEALNASFDGDRFAPPPLTDDECAAIAARGSET